MTDLPPRASNPERASPELSRQIAAERVTTAGIEVAVDAGPAECGRVARRLGIEAVLALAARWTLTRLPGAVVAAAARLDARVVQLCVVTQEPVEATILEHFTVLFVPPSALTDDEDPESIDQIPYEGRMIDLGEATVEQLALSLDPFPRAAGIDAAPGDPAGAEAAQDAAQTASVHPFAVLGRRRPG